MNYYILTYHLVDSYLEERGKYREDRPVKDRREPQKNRDRTILDTRSRIAPTREPP